MSATVASGLDLKQTALLGKDPGSPISRQLSLGMINEMAPSGQRAELVSAFLLVCYIANSLPVIGVGLLSRVVSASVAHMAFAALLAALAVVACVVGRRYAPQS